MKYALAAFLCVLLAGCSSGPPSPTPNQKMFVLAGHLSVAELPTGWTLTRYGLRAGNGFIDAKLDFEARLDALAIAPNERYLYFTTPCPEQDSPAWRVFDAHEDVFIAVTIDGRHRFLVSCRSAI